MCELEKCIAFHCGAAMCGIKASNLIRCDLDKYDNAEATIAILADNLSNSGISMSIVHRTSSSVLLLVYRHKVLSSALSDNDVRQFLVQYGYSVDWDVCQCIDRLSHRIAVNGDFPHEIGLFLGYPLEDVVGFINKDTSKYSGLWKVYGDVNRAKAKFVQIDRCNKGIMRRIALGHTLTSIFRVAI